MKEKGQLSVFLGVSMTVVVSLLAFIVNVGLFVKAKINLQNAVDSAAWAGAAVQARQLTNMAYLNWEMRNNYKEWMFKQYVLGQVALSSVANPDLSDYNNAAGSRMQFRGKPFDEANYPNEYEKFNLPSICIHFGTGHNICDLVRLPGLPRFNTVGLPSISEHHEEVLSALAKTKRDDCSRRTEVNFGAALLWAYGTGTAGGLSFEDMPLIASSRIGAWIKAMEMGLRMRNLEAQMNRPPVTEGLDFSSANALAGNFPGNERPLKAFMSAFRNLGGGDIKALGDGREAFTNSFRLYEISPDGKNYGGLSEYLIPNDASVAGEGVSYNPKIKYYVDLQALPINFVSFFTTFVSLTGKFQGGPVDQEANCGGSKTGMPVPGFMFGFKKNPQVMSYYTVKGEGNFVGLFYPFDDREGMKIKAYASAKPFGGRIGPPLFQVEGTVVKPRVENESKRSGAYLSAIQIPSSMSDPSVPIKDRFPPGTPIPLTPDFWVRDDNDPVGGTPEVGDVFFAIPNLLYEYTGDMDIQVKAHIVRKINDATSLGSSKTPEEEVGLYATDQYKAFKANYAGSTAAGAIIAQADIERAINRSRRPTRYEALNYLVPVIHPPDTPVENKSTISALPPESCPFPEASCFQLYAPLFGPGTMFPDQAAPSGVIVESITSFDDAITKFLNALRDVSDSIREQDSKDGGTGNIDAANSIFKRAAPGSRFDAEILTIPTGLDAFAPECVEASIAQNFNHFFRGSGPSCDITPLNELILRYFDFQANNNGAFAQYHVGPYVVDYGDTDSINLMSGYMPGERQGAQVNGSVPTGGPLNENSDFVFARRNFYSTKFIPTSSLTGGIDTYAQDGRWMFLERPLTQPPPGDANIGGIQNLLNASDLGEWESLFF